MKLQNILYAFVMLFSTTTYSQEILWQKTYGGMHAEYLYDAVPTLDYGFILVGGSLSNNTGDVSQSEGDFDYFITKIKENGTVEWTKSIGGEKTDVLKSITSTYTGDYLIAGTSNSAAKNNKTTPNVGQQDIWLVKIDKKGNIAWQKTLGGLANENVHQVLKTKDGGYLIAGTSASDAYTYAEELQNNKDVILKTGENRGNLDYWLVKLDKDGKEQWQKNYGGKYKDELRKVVETSTGEIVIAGVSNSPRGFEKQAIQQGLSDWWVLKLTREGTILWQKTFGEEGNDQLNGMLLTKEEDILLGGSSASGDKGVNSDYIVKKINQEGAILWENSYSQADRDILTDMVQNNDGTILLSGYATSKPNQNTTKNKQGIPLKGNAVGKGNQKGTEDYIVLKINQEGEELWRKEIGTDKKEVLKKSIRTRDGGYVLLGSSMPLQAKQTNNANFWVVKLRDKDKPEYKKEPLESIPNPTKDYTQIVIGNEYKDGTLSVVDYGGRILEKIQLDGKRLITINLSTYADGIYIIHVKTDIENNSVKVVKITN